MRIHNGGSLQANAIFKSAKERKTIWQTILKFKKFREPTCEALDPISLAQVCKLTRYLKIKKKEKQKNNLTKNFEN